MRWISPISPTKWSSMLQLHSGKGKTFRPSQSRTSSDQQLTFQLVHRLDWCQYRYISGVNIMIQNQIKRSLGEEQKENVQPLNKNYTPETEEKEQVMENCPKSEANQEGIKLL